MTVIVIGNCTVDISFPVQHLPREGETLLASGRHLDLGGKGANQAVVAARFGANVRFAAALGQDADGEWAHAALEREGLRTDTLLRPSCPTDQSLIFVDPAGANTIVSTHEAAAAVDPAWVREMLIQHGRRGDILLMQGNLSLPATAAALVQARAMGIATLLNPAPIQYSFASLLPLIDTLLMNEIEANTLGGPGDAVAAAVRLQGSGVPLVIVTLGAEGAVLIDLSGAAPFAAPAVRAVDTVGAGDTLCGAFAAGRALGLADAAALRAAIEAASQSVTRHGTMASFPSRAEARAILARYA